MAIIFHHYTILKIPLAEKYNDDGTIKPVHKEKNIDDLQRTHDGILLDNQILKCQVQKLGFENQILLLNKNIV